jgi:formylglycine-generating enzyme required for sulfatase activity
VNWYEAYAFCIWDGGFLPSEAEWEYAAAGGSEELEYPWGSTAPGTGDQYAINGCTIMGMPCWYTQVGMATLGAARWGQLDMSGEASEWTLDWYARYEDPCTDCSYLSSTGARVIRACEGDPLGEQCMLPPSRSGSDPSIRNNTGGFRCARTP